MISQKFPRFLRENGKGPGCHGNSRDDRVGNHIRLNLSSGERGKKAAGTTFETRRLELKQSVPSGVGWWPEPNHLAVGFPSLGTEVASIQSCLYLLKQTIGRVERACCR